MTETLTETKTADQVTAVIKQIAAGYGSLLRSPLLKDPEITA